MNRQLTLSERKQDLHAIIDGIEDEGQYERARAALNEAIAPPITEDDKRELDLRFANYDRSKLRTWDAVEERMDTIINSPEGA